MSDRLRAAREKAGFATAVEAARRFGWLETTYRHHENGTRNFPKYKAMQYAKAFKVSPEWLLLGVGDLHRITVPLVGYVGAGAVVISDDCGELDNIECPPGVGSDAVAVRVRGDSMYPRYMDGDVLIYDGHTSLQNADGHECVISLNDGRKFVKTVRMEIDRTATLESWNAPPIRSVEVDWVAFVKWVKRF